MLGNHLFLVHLVANSLLVTTVFRPFCPCSVSYGSLAMGLHGPVLAVTWLFVAPELGRVSRENVNPEVWEEEVRVLFRPIGFEGLMCTVGS